MRDEELRPGPTANRGGHVLDAFCASGLSPPDGDLEAEINQLIEGLANLTAELLIEGKLDEQNPDKKPNTAA